MTGEGAQEDHRYPFAGQANAKVRLGIVPLEGGKPVWMDPGYFEYLARVDWLPDERLAAQLLNREQTKLKLGPFEIHSGQAETLLCETSPVWVNLNDLFNPLPARNKSYPGGFIWGFGAQRLPAPLPLRQRWELGAGADGGEVGSGEHRGDCSNVSMMFNGYWRT